MTTKKPRGRPFESGNPGRPRGTRNKITQLMERLAEDQAESILRKAVELAQGGDVTCLRMMLDRLYPARKGQPSLAAIWTAVGDGRLTPEETSALSTVVDRSVKAIELHDITQRIAALEKVRDRRDESNNFPPA
jgi:hypothetical protein